MAVAQETDLRGESHLKTESVVTAAADIERLIRDAVSEAGGDLEQQHLHLVLAFSTGHFATDPLRAQAARLTAWELANNLLVRGDLISAYAFEGDLWEQPSAEKNPLTVPADHGDEKEVIRSLFPITPMADSTGGHDTELAIVKMAEQVDMTTSPVMVIFTNRAASLTTDTARPIIGQDDERYQSVLESWNRLPPVNQSGASYEPVYDIVRAGGDLVTRSIDVVVLVPEEFHSAPLAEGARSARLQASAQDDSSPTNAQRGNPAALFIIVLLGLVAAGAFFFLRRTRAGGGTILTLNNNRFSLASAATGQDVCRLVGPSYIQTNGPDERAIEVPQADLPPVLLARFEKSGKGIAVKDEALTLQRVDGEIVSAPYPLKPNEEQELVFEGEGQPDPGRPPRQVTVRVIATLGEDT